MASNRRREASRGGSHHAVLPNTPPPSRSSTTSDHPPVFKNSVPCYCWCFYGVCKFIKWIVIKCKWLSAFLIVVYLMCSDICVPITFASVMAAGLCWTLIAHKRSRDQDLTSTPYVRTHSIWGPHLCGVLLCTLDVYIYDIKVIITTLHLSRMLVMLNT